MLPHGSIALQERVRLSIRRGFFIRVCSGPGTGCPGQWAQPELMEFKKSLVNTLLYGLVLGGDVHSQKLDSMIFIDPSNLGYSRIL